MLTPEAEESVNKFIKEVIKQSKSNLTRQGKGRGRLYNSLEGKIEKDGTEINFYAEDYGEFVDKGVSGTERKFNTPYSFRNKMPPRKNILEWANKKRLRLRDKETGRFKKGGQNSLAFLIQRHIFKKGLRPTLFFTKPFERNFERLIPQLEESFVVDIENEIDKNLNNGTNI